MMPSPDACTVQNLGLALSNFADLGIGEAEILLLGKAGGEDMEGSVAAQPSTPETPAPSISGAATSRTTGDQGYVGSTTPRSGHEGQKAQHVDGVEAASGRPGAEQSTNVSRAPSASPMKGFPTPRSSRRGSMSSAVRSVVSVKQIAALTPAKLRKLKMEEAKGIRDRKLYHKMLSETDLAMRDEEDCEHLGDIMACSHVLRGVPGEVRAALARLAPMLAAEHGHRIFERGQASDACYIVLSGEVDLIIPDRDGDRSKDVKLQKVTAGQSFGDSALVADPGPRVSDAVANLGPYPKGKDPVLIAVISSKTYGVVMKALTAQKVVRALSRLGDDRSEEDIELLNRCIVDHSPCFANIAHQSRSRISVAMELCTVATDEIVYDYGDASNALYISLTATVGLNLALGSSSVLSQKQQAGGPPARTASTSSKTPGSFFGEKCIDSDRKARGERARVQMGGLLIRLRRGRLIAAMSEVADGMMQIKLDMIKTALMIGDHDLSMDQLIKVQQCFTENQLESGFVVGTQESAIDTLYIIRTGTCVAQLDVTMVSPLKKKRSTPRASNGVPSVEPMPYVRKSLLVSTAGPGECMGLVDYYVGGGSWTVNYITREVVNVWQAPVQRLMMYLDLLPRKSMADAKDVAARAWQARARRLETALSMLKSRGMELSMPDQDKVFMINSGGAARRGGMALDATRDATLAASLPMIESLEHMAENRESKHKAMDDLFSDGKFLGTHLAARRNREASAAKKLDLGPLQQPSGAPAMLTRRRLESLSTPQNLNPFKPRRTTFAPNLSYGSRQYPPGCWLSPRTSRTKDNWVDPGLLRIGVVKDTVARSYFADKAAVAVRVEKEAQGRLDANPIHTTESAKGVFGELDVSASQVALTPVMERWLLNSQVAETMSTWRWNGLSFMPRSGRRPLSGDYVLRSTYENGRMRSPPRAVLSPRLDDEDVQGLNLSTASGVIFND